MTHPVNMRDVGVRLHELRQGMGVGVRAVAEMSGVSAATVSRIERGQDCSLLSFIALADLYGASLDDLIGREPWLRNKRGAPI